MGKRTTISLPWPMPEIRSNSRAHWAKKARVTKAARNAAGTLAKAEKVPRDPKASILIEYWPAARREDPQNVPTGLKAYIDGIADAMGCDDRNFAVDYPREFAGTRKPGEVVFHILTGGSAE